LIHVKGVGLEKKRAAGICWAWATQCAAPANSVFSKPGMSLEHPEIGDAARVDLL
jgi:hypothetical protein